MDELRDSASAYGATHYFPTRIALMAIPAPDTDALLVKLHIAAESIAEEFIESAYADARPLLEE